MSPLRDRPDPVTLPVMRVALLMSVLVACAQEPAKQFDIVRPLSLQRCVPTFMPLSPNRTEMLVASRPVVLDFVVAAFLECDFGRREVEAITVELVDDAGAPIAARVEVQGSGATRLVKVSFTAPDGGSVHLRLVAEPTIGVFSQSLRVLRFTTRSWTELPTRSCDGLVDGPGGESLCVNDGRLEFANRVVPVDGVAVTSSLVWLVRPTTLDGCFSDGGTAVQVPLPERAWAVAARGRQVAVSSSRAIIVVDEAGGVRRPGLEPDLSPGPAIAFFDDDTLFTSHPGGFDRVALDGSVPVRPFAGRLPVQVMSEEGLWTIDSNETLTLQRFDGGRAQTPGFGVPPSEGFALPDRVPLLQPGGGAIPVVGVPVPAPDGGITIDVVELPANLSPTWLTSKWLFARHLTTRTLWMTPRVP